MESLTLFPLAVISEQVSFLPTATCHFFPLFIVVVVLLLLCLLFIVTVFYSYAIFYSLSPCMLSLLLLLLN